jgi:hypothetical protein
MFAGTIGGVARSAEYWVLNAGRYAVCRMPVVWGENIVVFQIEIIFAGFFLLLFISKILKMDVIGDAVMDW